MKRMAQRRSGAFSLRMAARRRDSYSEATRAHENGDAGVGGCWGLGSRCCVVTHRAEANELVGVKVLK
jgi:hypothetical protein